MVQFLGRAYVGYLTIRGIQIAVNVARDVSMKMFEVKTEGNITTLTRKSS